VTGIRICPEYGLQASFELAAERLMVSSPNIMKQKYPGIFHWKATVDETHRMLQGKEKTNRMRLL
jgi:hypothetical protein